MKYYLVALVASVVVMGCSGASTASSTSTPANTPTSAALPAQSPLPVASPSAVAQSGPVKATYTSCAVYASATDFMFEQADGKQVVVRQNADDKSIDFKVNLVDDDPKAEGPPGAAPKWVGKEFVITYGSDGKVTQIAPLEEATP